MSMQRGVHKRATELLESGNVDAYAEMLGRAVAVRKADGRDNAATALLATEADRWLGEGRLRHDLAEPIGLAAELEAAAA